MHPFKLGVCLALAIPFALAACGGGSKVAKKLPHQHWSYDGHDYVLELRQGKMYRGHCIVLEENVSALKHSSPSEHNPDYTTPTFVVTSKSEHYPAKSGDKFCVVVKRITSYIETKENEFIVHASLSNTNEHGAAQIDYALLERHILSNVAALGKYGGFKYGVFDNTEERTQEAESQVTGSTSRTTGSETGIVTPIYKSTYGVRFGNERTTTSVDRTPNSITVNRKHFVRFYNSKPNTDGYFNVDLLLKTFDSEKIIVRVGASNANYCEDTPYYECGFFNAKRSDYR